MPTKRWSDDESGDSMDSDPNEFFDLVDIIERIEIRAAAQEEFPLEEDDDTT